MLALDPAIAGSQQSLMDHFDAMVKNYANVATSPAGLAIGSSSTAAVKIVNTTTFNSSTVAAPGVGVPKSKTTAEVAFTATVHDIPANAVSVQEQVYLITLDSAGTPTITAGGITSGLNSAPLPTRPALGANGTSFAAVIGYVRIAVNAAVPGSGTNFVAGTTALSAARLAQVVYTDVTGYYGRVFSGAQ